ncbi:MAG: ROK family protein [Coprothermobacterota bacterium]|nr:ROK family protein [Coprothermobacterota bacterium]
MSLVGLGIDVGGTKIKGICMDEEGRVLAEANVATGNGSCEEEVLGNLFTVIDTLLNAGGATSIGIGCAGPVDPILQIAAVAPNIAFLRNYPLGRVVEGRYGIPTRIENDVKVAALGELYFGQGMRVQDFVLVTLGTGIGGTIVHEGKLLRGVGNAAGEIGHLTLERFGPQCGCGKQGCYEALASGTAIRRSFLYALGRGRHSKLSILPSEEIDAVKIAEAAREGDRLAIEVFEVSAFYTGLALSYLVGLLNPQRIIIGGGMSAALDLMWEKIQDTLTLHTMDYPLRQVEVVPSGLGNRAGVLGAAMMSIRTIRPENR